MAAHSSILAWRIPWTVHGGRKELDKTEGLSTNITSAQGKANQITMRYHLTPVRMVIIKKEHE